MDVGKWPLFHCKRQIEIEGAATREIRVFPFFIRVILMHDIGLFVVYPINLSGL